MAATPRILWSTVNSAPGPPSSVCTHASRAGVNKERLYNYFGDKRQLFSSVLAEQLGQIADAVPLVITSLNDVGEFATRTFDYQLQHPELGRLVIWEGLTDTGALPDEAERSALYRQKVQTIRTAQEARLVTDAVSAPHLLFLPLSISSWWASAPQLARMIASEDEAGDSRTARRAAVKDTARRIAGPR